jgi:hypothetical protein
LKGNKKNLTKGKHLVLDKHAVKRLCPPVKTTGKGNTKRLSDKLVNAQITLKPGAFKEVPHHEVDDDAYVAFTKRELRQVNGAHAVDDCYAETVNRPSLDVTEFLTQLPDSTCGAYRRSFMTAVEFVHNDVPVLAVTLVTGALDDRDDVWSCWTLSQTHGAAAYKWFQRQSNLITDGVLEQDLMLGPMLSGPTADDRKDDVAPPPANPPPPPQQPPPPHEQPLATGWTLKSQMTCMREDSRKETQRRHHHKNTHPHNHHPHYNNHHKNHTQEEEDGHVEEVEDEEEEEEAVEEEEEEEAVQEEEGEKEEEAVQGEEGEKEEEEEEEEEEDGEEGEEGDGGDEGDEGDESDEGDEGDDDEEQSEKEGQKDEEGEEEERKEDGVVADEGEAGGEGDKKKLLQQAPILSVTYNSSQGRSSLRFVSSLYRSSCVCHPSTFIVCVGMVATPIRSSAPGCLLLLVCHRGKTLLEYGGRAYGLVNQNIAGLEEPVGKKPFHQLVPAHMKHLRLRTRYIALDTLSWVLLPPAASVRAWLHPGAVVTTTHLVTASSLTDILKGVAGSKNSYLSGAVKLDLRARYSFPCELPFPFFTQPVYRMRSGKPFHPDSLRLWQRLLPAQVPFALRYWLMVVIPLVIVDNADWADKLARIQEM